MKTQIFKKSKILLITFLSTLLTFCAIGYAKSFSVAKADQNAGTINSTNFLPKSDLENLALTNASAVYSDDNLTAIIDDSSKLTIHLADETINIDNLSQMLDVKLFDENTLFFTANARLYAYDLQQKTYDKVLLNDANNNDVSVSYFDFNDNFLVTTYQSACQIFTIQDGAFRSYGAPIPISNGSNVAINSNNQLFLVGTSGIYKTLANEPAIQTPNNTLTDATPSQIISNNEFVYYVINDKIYSLSVNGGSSIEFTTLASDQVYNLGKIVNKADGSSSIKYLTFCGNNLLVVQNDTIQEFAISDNQLVFTGFAIAKGKTAYNRISDSATQIEKTNKNVAVLDPFKLTVYTKNNLVNKYARENYKNYLVSDLTINQVAPSSFALGENNAILLYNAKTSNSFVAILDFSKQGNSALSVQPNLSEQTSFIRDICYQSGYYYLLCDDGSAPNNIYTQHIYRANANDESFNFTPIASFNNPIESLFTNFNVDTYANVYVANKTTVAKLDKANNYTVQNNIYDSFNNITKLQTDLLGNLYVLDNGQIKKVLDGNIDTSISINNVKSFGFDFVDDNLYYLIDNSETIFSSTDLENVSIEDLKVSQDFYLTNPQNITSANQNLEFYTIDAEQNAYVVDSSKSFNAGDKFVFKSLSKHQSSDEYVLICTIECLGEQRFYALANQNTFVLIDITLVNRVDKQKDTSVNQSAFITTNVNAYYLPIITPNDTFALNDSLQKITLTKSTEIRPLFKINFLGCDYYYAEFTDNGTTKTGYIPCDFTVDVLTEDLPLDEFTNSGVVNDPAVAVRNVVIILAVITCVFSSSLYFILRKKRS